MQLEKGITYVNNGIKNEGDKFAIDVSAFETATGVGINITEADIQGWLDE